LLAVYPDRTADFKIKGLKKTAPFQLFSEADQKKLDEKLREANGEFADFEKLNTALGIPLFHDGFLWDDDPAQTAERLKLPKETETSYMCSYRRYLQNDLFKTDVQIAGQSVFSLALYGNPSSIDYITAVFNEQNDNALNDLFNKKSKTQNTCNTRTGIAQAITHALGPPEELKLGDHRALEQVLCWRAGAHTLLLNNDDSNIFTLRIVPATQANWGKVKTRRTTTEKEKLYAQLKTRIQRRNNGDVILTDLPMINQGPIGYCVPATWERYMRYMGIPGDMYILAANWDADDGKGTYRDRIKTGVARLLYLSGASLSDQQTRISTSKIKYYIEKGQPVMWSLFSTPAFNERANQAATTRKKIRNANDWKHWKSILSTRERSLKSLSPSHENGHMCLIIGYNESTGEIAISDSWGEQYAERWILAKEAEIVSRRYLYVINL
jgi:hypothetical protein